MGKIKIVFLCHFSNKIIRQRLDIRSYRVRKDVMKLLHKPNMLYDDYAIWVSDYIEEFEKHSEYEFHIIAPHFGMKRRYQYFDLHGIHYHFWGYMNGLIYSLVNKYINFDKITDCCYHRKRIKTIISKINPDIICLCGAENPYYSLGIVDVKDIPVYVILQTFLNDLKRIEMGVGDEYRRKCEKRVFQHAGYFCTQDTKAIDYIKGLNSKAQILPTKFPTHIPVVGAPKEKTSDFVFYARTITANKGVEDVLKALSLVKRQKKDILLSLIGSVEKDYSIFLHKMISDLDISDNISFKGFYRDINETYKEVMQARVVVVPGITATLNSTVRESMLMGLPTICYEDACTIEINRQKQCLMTAKMRNIEELASLMVDTVQDPEKTRRIAQNGLEYANSFFGNEAIVNIFLDHCQTIIKEYNNQI